MHPGRKGVPSIPARTPRLFGDSERCGEKLKQRARSDAVCLDYRQTASSLATRKQNHFKGRSLSLRGSFAPGSGSRGRLKAQLLCLGMPQNPGQNRQSPQDGRWWCIVPRENALFSGRFHATDSRSRHFSSITCRRVMPPVPCTTAFQGHRDARREPNLDALTAAYSQSASHYPLR